MTEPINPSESAFLKSIKRQPSEPNHRLVFADWLDEHGRVYEAFEQRVKAGFSLAQFKLRRKSDGLFSSGGGNYVTWTTHGKVFRRLNNLQLHLRHHARSLKYADQVPWDQLEVVVFEERLDHIASFGLNHDPDSESRWGKGEVNIQQT